MVESQHLERACAAWDMAASDPWVGDLVSCRSGLSLGELGPTPRFAYLSAGSPIESLLGPGVELRDRRGGQLAIADLVHRLLGGEVAALLASSNAADHAPRSATSTELPEAFLERRQQIRSDNVQVRFLIRQIGLEEVATHRGAPADLYHAVSQLWSRDLALAIDPAMLLSLGADRQRYVDEHYVDRANQRLPRALGRLLDLGVRSYPRLVIL